MIVESLAVHRFSLSLYDSFPNKSKEFASRDGLIIQMTDDEGHVGLGEIAPLPGFSPETLNEAEAQTIKLKVRLEGEDIPDNIDRLDGTLRNWLNYYKLLPSVQCGIEAACLTLKARETGKSLARLINDNAEQIINVNGLLYGDEQNILRQAKQMREAGFRTIKVKIGHLTVKKAAQLVRMLGEETHEQALIRLDVNQAWNYEQALEFAGTVGLMTIEYIEEPFKDIKKIPEFYERTMIPVALDESLLTRSLDDIRHIDGIDVLVLKPTILGGLEKTWQIAQFAHVIGLKAVITSSFDSSLGLYTLAQIAANLPHYVSYGLDTIKFLKEDVLKKPIKIDNGQIDIRQFSFDPSEINFDILKRVV
ncbi:MAG: o-succinylbenzoate synthase [Candidatus Omnitrophica bacterium]|nr:o-succinylbenzoate synthase [Candidatus Omnitrophota bacterium]